MLDAFGRYREMVEDADLARRLGVSSLDDLPVAFVGWAHDFRRLEGGLGG